MNITYALDISKIRPNPQVVGRQAHRNREIAYLIIKMIMARKFDPVCFAVPLDDATRVLRTGQPQPPSRRLVLTGPDR
jgi:hypothetical protein